MKSAHDPYALNSFRAPGREAARNRNRPAARSPSDHAPHPRQPCGSRQKTAQQPARARRVLRSRPQPGPGPGKSHPAWAETRSGECESFISIQRLREVPGRTKPRSGSVAQTLASFLVSSAPSQRRSAAERLRATERRRRERARGAARAPHRCACSPLGERATVEWPQRRFYRRAAAPSRSDADPQGERRQDLGPDHTPMSGGRVLPAQPADPRPVDLRPTMRGDLGKT
jgi:hypothetical protein